MWKASCHCPARLELLSSLSQERWAIVTSCTRALAEARLKAAGLPRPRTFVTSTDVAHGKPEPDPYLKGAEMLGFSPDECVVVEDAPAGIRAGKSAGSRVIGLRTMLTDPELKAVGADWQLDNCAAITLDPAAPHDRELSLLLETDDCRFYSPEGASEDFSPEGAAENSPARKCCV